MFLDKVIKYNKQLIEFAFNAHNQGMVNPDTYIIDYDYFVDNARQMLECANEKNIDLYYMLKQVGRNPMLAKTLEEIGYKGAVAVDFKEAEILMNNNCHICNLGHLVQTPKHMLEKFITYGVDYITVYSIEKIIEINNICKKHNIKQKLMIKLLEDASLGYSGQTSGFKNDELQDLVSQIKDLSYVEIKGLTAFPCFLYDYKSNEIVETENMHNLLKAKDILQDEGIHIENVNAPSVTCTETLNKMNKLKVNSAEPGHGLTGSTPFHAVNDTYEKPCVVYMSEVSHQYENCSYFYGGGFYRRGHFNNAIVGTNINDYKIYEVQLPDLDSIDYYFNIKDKLDVSSTVIASFRFQIFVTRSDVCIVKGLHSNNIEILGTYDSLGRLK